MPVAAQDGEGAPVVRMAPDGSVGVHPAPELTIRATHDGDVWLTGGATVVVPPGFAVRPPRRRCRRARDSSSCSMRTAATAR